jgi:hypothetical protein
LTLTRFRGINQEQVVQPGLETGLSADDAACLRLWRALRAESVTLDTQLGAHATAF